VTPGRTAGAMASPVRIFALVALGLVLVGRPGDAGAQPAARDRAGVTTASPETPATRSAAPVRIALQAGHWRAAEAPEELARLRSNGTMGGGRHEWEVTLEIARQAAGLLEARGYEVEILPTTVPPGYRADLFIAIHADGFHSPAASGFSVAAPRRDATGQGQVFADLLAGHYRAASGLRHRVATRRMQGYYAFNSRRYRHALDPLTPAVILEAGFLTSPADREILVHAPDRLAQGIAAAVEEFLPLAPELVRGNP
jgi:hypothetical protein